MKLRRKNPCPECPFRKVSPPGWLGPWDVNSIVLQAHSEAGLACHMDGKIKKELPDQELYDKVHVCVGSLLHANVSAKSYTNPDLKSWAEKVGTSDQIMNTVEFFKHHASIDKLIKKKRRKK